MAHARPFDLREYELTVRQEPKQARMCGVGGKGLFFSLLSACHFLSLHRPYISPTPPVLLLLHSIVSHLFYSQPIVAQLTLHRSYNFASLTAPFADQTQALLGQVLQASTPSTCLSDPL
ncbi:hypothetical protein NLI96_g10820 [Meripilus lineatus]|uniref:Uncharacterized protein n=1 Tax=Meripilus lineatus TaxID=2056292 RepID=A0AAD5UXZ7_9APHY|nr:hypothetical protein NLI96_g10820 [Physisporinus lineatus]